MTTPRIDVMETGPGLYAVTVTAARETRHTVTLDPEGRAVAPEVPPERLIEESFRFLLEREPQTAILGQFDLSVVSRYFPEWEAEMQKRLATP